jgi:hypothetical protein
MLDTESAEEIENNAIRFFETNTGSIEVFFQEKYIISLYLLD